MALKHWYRLGSGLIIAGAFLGLIFSLYNYFTPLTGITASFGALLVCGSSIALMVDGLCLSIARRKRVRSTWLVLGFLGAIGTLAAGYFLHTSSLMGLMVVVLAGLILNYAVPPRAH